MARLRISRAARADLESILAVSVERWGELGRARYQALLDAALRAVAGDPEGPVTKARPDLAFGVRSFHIRHVRHDHGVKEPVHVLYYRAIDDASIEIVRLLHDRMEPHRHIHRTMPMKRKRSGQRP